VAAGAAALGIANPVVAESELAASIDAIVAKLLANAPLAQRAMKKATLLGLPLSYEEALRTAHTILDQVIESRDAKEGMRAFVEKRKPVWRGE
jgi:enoyl-CoA hydratase/carnithine racemase